MALAFFHDALFNPMDDMLLHPPHMAFQAFPRGRKMARLGPHRLAKQLVNTNLGRSRVVEAEDGTGVTLVADLPGFRRDEVDVQVRPGATRGTHVLQVRGEHRETATNSGAAIEAAPAKAALEAAPPAAAPEDGVIRDEGAEDDEPHAEEGKPAAAKPEEGVAVPAATRPGPRWTSCSSSSFERTFVLPAHVDVDGVRAKLDNGVLQVWIPRKPKEPEEEPRRITIH